MKKILLLVLSAILLISLFLLVDRNFEFPWENGTTPTIPEKEYVPTEEEFTSESFAITGGSKNDSGEYYYNFVNNSDGTADVTYTGILPKSYKYVSVSVSEAVQESAYIRVKIKNNGTEGYVKVRIDVWSEYTNAVGIKTINEEAWMNGERVSTDLKFGGSFFDIPAGEEAECIVKFYGIPSDVLFMVDSSSRDDKESYDGSITLSNFGYTGTNDYVKDSVTLDKSEASLTVGDELTLTATASGEVEWSTSNGEVAKVENGKITAVAEGTATITATCGEATATCIVTVTANSTSEDSVTLDQSEASLTVGEELTLTATASGEVKWTTDNEAVAKVENGKITAVAEGTAIIKASCGNATATCTVTVTANSTTEDPHSKETMVICGADVDLADIGGVSGNGTFAHDTVNTYGTSVKAISWSNASSANSIYIRSKTLTYAVTADGYIEFFVKNVNHVPSGNGETINGVYIQLIGATDDVRIGSEVKAYKTYNAECSTDAGNGWIKWTVPLSMFGVEVGTQFNGFRLKNYVAFSENEYMYIDGINIVAGTPSEEPEDSVTLDKSEASLTVGEELTLTATASGEVKWTTDNEAVAKVENGKITAIAEGTATITASCGNANATCTVTVTANSTPEVVDHSSETMAICPDSEDFFQSTVAYWINGTYNYDTVHYYGQGASKSSLAWVANADVNMMLPATLDKEALTISANVYLEFYIKDTGRSDSATTPRSNGVVVRLYNGSTSNKVEGCVDFNAYKDNNLDYMTDAGNGWTYYKVPVTLLGTTGATFDRVRIHVKYDFEENEIMYLDGVRIVVEGEQQPEDSVTLDKSEASLTVGEELTLTATASGEVKWTTDNEAVAKVENGKITAVAEGTATITASCGNANATCTVTVTANSTPETVDHSSETMAICPDSDDFFQSTVAYWINGTYNYDTVHYYGQGTSKSSLAWVANADVNMMLPATLDKEALTISANVYLEFYIKDTGRSDSATTPRSNGVVVRLYNGSTSNKVEGCVDFKAYKDNNSDYMKDAGNGWTYYKVPVTLLGTTGATFDRVRINVKYDFEENEIMYLDGVRIVVEGEQQPEDSVTLDKSEASLTVGEELTLTATASGEVKWTSDKEAVATVENGKITAIAEGTATITASCGNATATCTVTVTVNSTPEDPHSKETMAICGADVDLADIGGISGEGTFAHDYVNTYGTSVKAISWSNVSASSIYIRSKTLTYTVTADGYIEFFVKNVNHVPSGNGETINGVYIQLIGATNDDKIGSDANIIKAYKTYNAVYSTDAGNGWIKWTLPLSMFGLPEGTEFNGFRLLRYAAFSENEYMYIDGIDIVTSPTGHSAEKLSIVPEKDDCFKTDNITINSGNGTIAVDNENYYGASEEGSAISWSGVPSEYQNFFVYVTPDQSAVTISADKYLVFYIKNVGHTSDTTTLASGIQLVIYNGSNKAEGNRYYTLDADHLTDITYAGNGWYQVKIRLDSLCDADSGTFDRIRISAVKAYDEGEVTYFDGLCIVTEEE